MSKVNEFDAMFGNTPDVTATPEAKVLAAAPETTSSEDKNEFEGLFSPEGHAVPSNGLSAKDVAALSGVAGAAYGAVKAKPGSDNIISRGAERMYGAPKGSLAEMQGLREPALPPTTGQAAQAVAARYSGPFEVDAQTNTRLPVGSTGFIPETISTVEDTTPGGKWRTKTGFGKGTGTVNDVVLAGRRATPSGPISGRQAKLFGIPQAGEPTALMDRLMQQGQSRDAIPAPVVAPLTDMAKNIERANLASRGAQRGAAAVRGGVGSGLTALQAYGMSEDMSRGRTPEWQDVASLIGGPAAAFGGKLLGPLGMAAQVPLTLRDRELIAREMSMGDVVSPTAGFTGAEMMQPAFTELTDPRMAYPGQGRTR